MLEFKRCRKICKLILLIFDIMNEDWKGIFKCTHRINMNQELLPQTVASALYWGLSSTSRDAAGDMIFRDLVSRLIKLYTTFSPVNLRQGVKSCETHVMILFHCLQLLCTCGRFTIPALPCITWCLWSLGPLETPLQISKCPLWVEPPSLRSTSLEVCNKLGSFFFFFY